MSVDMERLTRQTREALVYSLGPTRNCEALFDYVGDMDFKNDFVFVVEDHDKALSEITDSAIKPALGIIKSQAAEIERLREALRKLIDGADAETAAEWECNSYHPKFINSLEEARSVLSGEQK